MLSTVSSCCIGMRCCEQQWELPTHTYSSLDTKVSNNTPSEQLKHELINTAIDVHSLPPARCHENPPTVIALDGTWAQAKGMYAHNPTLSRLTQVVLGIDTVSEYVIRTQPTHNSLSTLECVAHTLAWLEESPTIVEVSHTHLPRPLPLLPVI